MEATIDIPVTALATNKDFVCGMKVEAGQIADTATYEGKIYGFCSKECKDEFVKDPNSYLSQK
ncbi:MAG: YHS domain-containing protein [Bacteroidetes bacterium]|nr:YHS domain-containing protein [Bacteroidota bacterium]